MSCRRPSILTSAALALALGGFAHAEDDALAPIAEAAVREAREIIATDLFGHYDVVGLRVVSVEPLKDLQESYGVAAATLDFSTTRNATRHASLNPAMFEPGS